MKHTLFLFASFFLASGVSTPVFSHERTEAELYTLALQHFRNVSTVGGSRMAPPTVAELQHPYSEGGLHVFEAAGRGFVVLAANEQAAPVLAYSSTPFPAADMPDGLRWWLQGMAEALQRPTLAPMRAPFTPVENLIQTEWGQEDPYNFLCPQDGKRKMPTGCVATAMAQIFYYLRYPAQGHGDGSYKIGNTGSPIAMPIQGVYDYDLMSASYKGKKLTDEERLPVATLMRDLGYSCRMSYGTGGSGALSNYAAQGLVNNFDYDSLALHAYHREYFTTEEWMGLIQEELRQCRPFYYAASDPKEGGHAFVFSGIDAEGRVYVNWGWSGLGNGYYNVELLDANDEGRSLGNYTTNQHMIIGMKPVGTAHGETYQTHLALQEPISVSNPTGSYLSMRLPEVYNYSFLNFYGEVGYLIESFDAANDYSLFVSLLNTANAGYIIPYHASDSGSKMMNMKDLPAGHYRIRPVCKPVQTRACQPVRSYGGLAYVDVEKLASGKFAIGEILTGSSVLSVSASGKASTSPWYDLSGRSVARPEKGIFIRDGRKVLQR